MKKIYLALGVVVLSMTTQIALSQNLEVDKDYKKNRQANVASKATPATPAGTPTTPDKCGYNFIMQRARANGFNDAAFEAEISRIVARKKAENARFTGPVNIPVIFHVIYRTANTLGTASPNLSASKFTSQIDQLNKDYGNLSGSAYGVATDMQIRFCLALVDTAGRPLAEPGIERINGQTRSPAFSNTNTMTSPDAIQSYFEATVKPATIWDPTSYFNIWTAAMDNSGLLGYATFPGLSTLPGLDAGETNSNAGVVLNWRSIGSVLDPGSDTDYGYGRTLTHEAGHFFGLRHIWGDATCGNDYCADTPPQDDATSGCPATGTLNNCTPSQAKMFENYMDYSNDACLNTFTADQTFRCQTVMDNSPRRLSLITSKACQARAGNAISFIYGGEYVASETGAAGTCPNSRTYAFRIYPSVQATGAATVTFSTAGSTAIVGRDFTISPASVTWAANETAAKTIFVTVIDDQEVEGDKKISISYTISGTGVVAGPDKQTLTINITDDDVAAIAVDNTTPTKTILSQNFNASTNIPTGWVTEVYGDGVTTPNQWVVSANGGSTITTNSAHITQNVSTKPNTYNNANISDAYLITPLIDATGLRELNLTFTWRSLGETGYDEGYLGYIPEGQAPTAANVLYFNTSFVGQSAAVTSSLNLPASMSGKKFYFVFNWFNDETVGTSPGFTVDDIAFTGRSYGVATTVDADTSFPVFTTAKIDFYSKSTAAPNTNRIIASIANASTDLGCITATVPFAGTNLVVLNTSAGSYQRSEKVIQLTPAAANTTATYQATFYYTTAELAAWGANVPNLKIMKVADGVNLSSTLTMANASLFTPTVNDQRATLGYASFTINATGGFSQFLLVSQNVVLPVNLLTFEARPNTKNILLSWSTATETNNKGFVVERNTDGTRFERIGWVDGAVNSSRTINYTYNDNFVQPDQLYYYRLRQTDMDARETLSEIRSAKIKGAKSLQLTISPNPAKGQLKVFASGTITSSDINLLDAEGRLVQSWKKVNCSTAPYTLDISKIAAGVYMVQVIAADVINTQKVIIQ
ncbi:MAG: M43 family zinc metalloprotease [Ferruginibacter sp.]